MLRRCVCAPTPILAQLTLLVFSMYYSHARYFVITARVKCSDLQKHMLADLAFNFVLFSLFGFRACHANPPTGAASARAGSMGAPSYVRTRATTHAQRESIPIELAVWSRPVQGREAETSREGGTGRSKEHARRCPPRSPHAATAPSIRSDSEAAAVAAAAMCVNAVSIPLDGV